MLRENVAQLRTQEAILHKSEQVLDGMERGVVSPKMGEQIGQCIKVPIALAKLEMSFLKMLQGFGRKAPVPRSPLLRSAIGLKEALSPSDGEAVRALLPDRT